MAARWVPWPTLTYLALIGVSCGLSSGIFFFFLSLGDTKYAAKIEDVRGLQSSQGVALLFIFPVGELVHPQCSFLGESLESGPYRQNVEAHPAAGNQALILILGPRGRRGLGMRTPAFIVTASPSFGSLATGSYHLE